MKNRRSAFALVLLAAPWLASCHCSPCGCPAPTLTLVVEATPDGGVVSDVEAGIVEVGDGECEPDLTVTVCRWYAGELDAGNYTVQVAAPGFRTTRFDATVNLASSASAGCNCKGGSLSPNSIVLTPSDGGP